MDKFNFYYDESEHSRKINHNTITADNYYDNFIAVIVGWKSRDEKDIEASYSSFENKYRERSSNGELKSTTLKQRQFQNGLASLSKDNVDFLEDFFDMFDDRVYPYYSIASKIEYLVLQLFIDYKNSLLFDMDSMKYSIIKALVMYQPNEILEGLYKDAEQLLNLLKEFFTKQVEIDKENERLKRTEIESFRQILVLLDDVSAPKTVDWNYRVPFWGFDSYLKEKGIQEYSLEIDREGGSGNTINAARSAGLHSVKETDSVDSFGVRMADILAGVTSKMLKALRSSFMYSSAEDGINKKILPTKWFDLNDRQLSLYKKMNHIMGELNTAWYKSFAGLYADDLLLLLSLLSYMSQFENSEAISRDIKMQGEYFNSYASQRLLDYFERIQNKLPVDIVNDNSKEYFLNRRGAKVFFESSKQPKLKINNNQEVFEVLSVGFSNDNSPMVTVSTTNEPMCFRIDDSLAGWAMMLVGLANRGDNIFPCKVAFSISEGQWFADLL